MTTLRASLMRWVNTFAGPSFCDESSDLPSVRSGHVLAEIMNQIFPDFAVDEEQAPETRLQTVADFLQAFHGEAMPTIDCSQCAAGNEEELEKLVTMMLCAAVQCDNKADFIRVITFLEDEVQAELMSAITHALPSPSAATGGAVAPQLAAVIAAPATPGAPSPIPRHMALFSPAQSPVAKAAVVNELRRDLQHARMELEDALCVNSELVAELNGKSKAMDLLKFRIQELEAKAAQVSALEDELDQLRPLKPASERLEKEVERLRQTQAAMPDAADYQHSQRELRELQSKFEEQSQQLSLTEARLKEFRSGSTQSQLKLTELEASLQRKTQEVGELLTQRESTEARNKELELEIATLQSRVEELSARPSEQGTSTMNELEAEYKMTHLLAENDTLKQRLASFEERIADAYKMQDRLEQEEQLVALLKDKAVTTQTELAKWKQQARDLKKGLDDQIAHDQSIINQANAKIEQANAKIGSLERELVRLKTELRQEKVASVWASHKASSASAKATPARKEMRDDPPATAAQRRKQHFGSAPPWAQEPEVSYEKPVDADRLAELRRRNERQRPHLQESYMLEKMTMPSSPIAATPVSRKPHKPAMSFEFDFSSSQKASSKLPAHLQKRLQSQRKQDASYNDENAGTPVTKPKKLGDVNLETSPATILTNRCSKATPRGLSDRSNLNTSLNASRLERLQGAVQSPC
eukprot:m.7724 g.7724  ORF g.7724 m.7724 type:complete len:701 (-) comp2793_c0_seq1:99-2201(-)